MTANKKAATPVPSDISSFLDAATADDTVFRALGLDSKLVPQSVWESALLGPAREAVIGGGKRFRGRLTEIAWELGGGLAGDCPANLPALVELIHAGSLVVDDIEDGSERRRGRPALHVQRGVPTALNTGNWLYFWPLFQMVGTEPHGPLVQQHAVRSLLRAHYGQALDVHVDGPTIGQRDVRGLVLATTQLKTGALMELAAFAGASAANASDSLVKTIEGFGCSIGNALQMLDDLSGLRSTRKRPKTVEDVVNRRLTWPWAWLASSLSAVEYAQLRRQWSLVGESLDRAGELVDDLSRYLGEQGFEEVSTLLTSALEPLRESEVAQNALDLACGEVERLKASYE